MIKIYHNPDCSKCQTALQLLDAEGQAYEAINYIENPPSVGELQGLLSFLGLKAEELVRKKEPLYISEFEGKQFSEEEWLRILSENPILIERPIIVKDNKAIIGRPPEKILSLI
jgi:arsenate reductase (glutaredoxin)